jgi:hypothetical protein
MSEQLSITPKVLELQETNDIYMTLTMCILSNKANLNNARFTDDFINGVVENKDSYIGIPLVANRTKLENGVYNNLSHEFDSKTGKLNTDAIGSFVDFWTDTEEDGTLLLMGSVRVYKRYPNVCNALLELYESGDLEMSCEVLVYGYESMEGKVRNIAYSYEDNVNSLFGSAVVSDPAEVRSRATLLVAEAFEKDLASQSEGGENVSEKNKQPETVVFNKGNEIRFHGTELSSLKFSDISSQIYNQLNPIDPKTGYREYEFWVCDLYNDYVLVEDWDDYSTLYKISYQVVNDTVVLDSQDKWIKGTKGFIPDGIDIDSLMVQQQNATIEIENKVNELNSQHKEVMQVTEEQIKQLQSKLDEATAKVEELNSKVSELNETIVSQEESKKALESQITELNSEVETLKPFKDQVETAEKQVKKDALVEKFSKLLSDEVMKSEAVLNAVEELNETELNSIVVAEVTKAKTVEVASKTETVIVSASTQEDLIPQSRREKLYGSKAE